MEQHQDLTIPSDVLLTAESLDDLDDWLSSSEPRFLAEMRRIRREEDHAGKGIELTELLKRWPIES